MNKQPIGIFDSGVGGLTVFKEIRKRFPNEDIVYFGDTARVPYGPKSPRTVVDFSIQNARFLIQSGAKIIIVACNTSSAVALEHLESILKVPVIGVIKPGARAAVSRTKSGKIGIIGTQGTIKSEAYTRAITELNPDIVVYGKSCPLFVPLVEEGWEDHSVAGMIIEEYLSPLLEKQIDVLVLGCTHYPILKDAISRITGNSIELIDSAEAVITDLEGILKTEKSPGKDFFYVSDNEEKFRLIASRILEKEIIELQRIKLGESWYID